jgi:hypothetical protein
MLRSLAVLIGCAIVAATAHVAILSAGGYAMPTTPLQIAVALGLCTGSICVGSALRDGRWLLAFVFVIALISGEAYAIITTSEITIGARDATAAPIRDAERARADALLRVARAEASKTAAESAGLTEASKPGCRRECRILLEDAKTNAERELNAAGVALNSLAPPRSATPLADRLHIAGWKLDLLTAALRSIAANGLGAALIAFGANGKSEVHRPRTARTTPSRVADAEPVRTPLPAPTARDHAVRFSRDVLTPADADTRVADLQPAYLDWCQCTNRVPFPTREIGLELADLFKRAGVENVDVGGTKYVSQAKIKPGPVTKIDASA